MATQSRPQDAALALDASASGLEKMLADDPTSFEFFQAVRLLGQLHPERRPVGQFQHPSEEVARFVANGAVTFPASEIQALEMAPDSPARMTVNFMGLTGPLGVLPMFYSLQAAERARARDTALRDFFDIFHHRMVSLFYRAWEKYRFTVTHEQGQRDRLAAHVLDLIGLGTSGLQGRLPVRDESLLFYAGLLAPQSRPAEALRRMLSDHFDVAVEIEQFVGGWYPLSASTQCSLGAERDASGQLGLGAVAGDEIWDQQSRVRVRLGPLTRRQYDQFLPTGAAYEPLRALTRFFGNEQLDFEFQLVLVRNEVPACVLGVDDDVATPLGWCTWLRSSPFGRDPDETVLAL